MGVFSELSVFLKVKPGREKQIREYFTANDADADRQKKAQQAVDAVGTLHEGRNVLFDDDTRLLVATSFDGDWDAYIDDFSRSFILESWANFLIYCEGFPDDKAGVSALSLDDWKEFLTAHQVTATSYGAKNADLTVKQIDKARRVMTAFEQVLDNPDAAKALEHPALKPLLELAAD